MAHKKLGQHFLRNPDILRRVADALSLQSDDTVIEIGPGRGALTRVLVESCKLKVNDLRIVAIEKDEKLAEELRLRIKDQGLEIITGDALEVLPSLIHDSSFLIPRYKLVGNIPFYITGKLFRIIGELEHKPETTVLMIQKEVAERVSAKPPKMNLLAASVQIWADAEMLFEVSCKEFYPRPKVDSAVIRLKVVSCKLTEQQRDGYYKLIKILFKQPRKTILNNLSDGLHRPKEELLPMLRALGLDARSRPQILSVELITKLLELISKP
ncbi:MAG: 16S rRNA (adenine(1518)-N(6)/adenine(1519)-N(6))-dimethyltransferase RsmA [Nanoarchaeota archaeon]|nr:16S rRNA (adenine(1518)-N(6)/adenine(1519)-N(6))-dimethyltransferase RsmA [Nanoarchaeota archaeon]